MNRNSRSLGLSSILQKIYSLLINATPIILILLEMIVFFGGKLEKFIGISYHIWIGPTSLALFDRSHLVTCEADTETGRGIEAATCMISDTVEHGDSNGAFIKKSQTLI